MGSSAARYRSPTSQNAPKLSIWVTVQGMTLPFSSVSRYSCRQRRCASARESQYTVSPSSSPQPVSTKQVGRPHAGQHGNVLDRFLRRVVHTFLKRHIGAPPAQRKPQAAAGVNARAVLLQHLPGLQAAGQFLPGQAVGVAAKTFGTIFQHVRFLSIP